MDKTTSFTLLAGKALVPVALLSCWTHVRAASYTWDGTSNTWGSSHWNPGLVAGTTLAADSATIGAGTVTFSKSDTFFDAGTLYSPAITINTGGTLASGGFFNTLWNLNLGGGTLLANGGANATYPAFQLGGTVTVSGSSASAISVGSGSNNAINLGSYGDLALKLSVADVTGNSNPDLTIGNVLQNSPAGAGLLVKSGAGTLRLSALNSYTGGTRVDAGTLELNYNDGGSGGTLRDGLTINSGATVALKVGNALGWGGNNWVRNITITGGTLRTDIAAADNGWGTTINLTRGTMSSGVGGGYFSMGSAPVFNVTGDTAASVISANMTVRDNITFNVTRGTDTTDLNISGSLLLGSSGMGIVKNGTGILTLGAANTYNGKTVINGGTVVIADEDRLGANPGSSTADHLTLNGGTLQTTATFSINDANRGVTVNASSGTFNTNSGTTLTVASAVTGTGAVVKDGTGTLILSGNNTYTGNTTISGGVLELAAGARMYNAAYNNAAIVTVNSGGTWRMPDYSYGGVGQLADYSARRVLNGGAIEVTGNTHASGQNFTVNATTGGTFNYTPAGQTLTLSGNANSNIDMNGPLNFTAGGNITVNEVIQGAGILTKSGAGVLTLSQANTYTGGTIVSAGEVALTAAAGAGTGGITMNDAATGAGNNRVTLGVASIATPVTVANQGTGASTLYGNVQYQGHSGTITLNKGAVLQIPGTGSGTDWWYAFNGVISGPAGVTIKGGDGGSNRVTLGAANTFAGGTVIESGKLQINTGATAGVGAITLGNGNTGASPMQLRTGADISNPIIVASGPSGTAEIGSYNTLQNFTGPLQVNGAVTLAGGGDRITWTGANAVWSGSGNITINGGRVTHESVANAWTGNMTINASSTFQPGHSASLTAANSVTVNGTLQLNNVNQAINGLSGSGAVQNVVGANTITVGAGGATSTFSGTLQNSSGALGLTKSGAGTLTLSGNNTHTGATTVNGGILDLTGSPTGNSAMTAANGATLRLNYGTNNTSKIHDSAVLTLGGGILDLNGGSHSEVVASTTLASGNSSITQTAGTSVINLNTLTRNAGATLRLGAASIATTDTLNTAGGILGGWATLGNTWAVNSTNAADGPITAFSGTYTDVNRLGGTIASAANSNVRIIDGGASGNVTMAAGGTTDIGTLLQGATGGAVTVDIGAGNTLRLAAAGGILIPSGNSGLTFSNGTLTAGGAASTAGDIAITNEAGVTMNSAVADNGAAVSVTKSGSGTLTFPNQKTYTGNTTVNAGVLDLTGGGGSGGTIRGTVTVNNGATLRLSSGDVTGFGTGADRLSTINLVGGTLDVNTTSNQTLGNATINMTGASITGVANSNLDFFQTTSALNSLASATTSTISGAKLSIRQSAGLTVTVADGAAATDLSISSVIASNASFTTAPLIKAGAGTLVLSNSGNTYSGGTSMLGGTLEVANINALGTYSGGNGYLGIANDSTFRYTGTGTQTDGRYLWIDTGAQTKTLDVTSSTGTIEFTSTGGNVNKPVLKTGAGRFTLADDLSSGASITVSAGTFRLGNGGGAGNLVTGTSATINSGGALEFYRNNDTAITGTFTGAGSLRFLSTGTSTQGHYDPQGNSSSFTGAVTVDLARLMINNVNDVGSASMITANNLGQVWLTGGVNLARPVTITGIGWLETAGNLGAIRIDGASTLSGPLTLAGNSRITAYGSGDTGTISGLINDGTGSYSLEKAGAGTLTISGLANTYDGGTTVSAGTLTASLGSTAGAKSPFGTGAVTAASGTTVRMLAGSTSNAMNVSNAFNLNGATLIAEDAVMTYGGNFALTGANSVNVVYAGKTATLTGVVSGTGSLSKTGGAELYLAGTSANTFSGTTILDNGNLFLNKTGATAIAGTFQMGAGNTNQPNLRMLQSNQFGSGVVMTFSNTSGNWARFDLMGTSQTLAGLSAGSSGTQAGAVIQNRELSGSANRGTSTLTLNGSGTYIYNGYLRDADSGDNASNLLALVKNGTGTQQFAGGQIAYEGGTTVNGGAIEYVTGNVMDNMGGGFTINAGGTIRAAAAQNLYGSLTMNGGSLEGIGAANSTYGHIVLGANITVGGSSKSTISADIRIGGNNNRTFTVNPTGDPSGIDLDFTGKLGHLNGITWGYMTKAGTGTLRLSNASNEIGSITVSAGKVIFLDSMAGMGNGGLINNSLVDTQVTGANTVSFAQVISGTGAFTKSGTGTFNLSSGSTYSGATTISGGTFLISGGGALGSGGTYAGAINNNGVLNVGSTANQTYSGVISGVGTLIKSNTGTLTLSGNNSAYAGTVTVSGGTLQLNNANAAGPNTVTLGDGNTGSSSTVLNAGANFGNAVVVAAGPTGAAAINAAVATPQLSGSLAVNRDVSMAGGSDRMTWTGAGANWTGTGNITVTSGRVTHDTSAGNTWSGNLTINSGATFQPGSSNTLRSVNSVTANGTLQLNNVSQTINGLSGSGVVQNIVGGNTLTLGAGNATSTFAGVIQNGSGTMTLVKSGTGTFTVTGVNTYTGGTTVSGGTFEIGGAGSLGSGSYAGNIANSGVLNVNTTAAQTLSGTLTGGGSLVKNNTGVLTLSTPKAYTGSTTVNAGVVTVNGTGTLSGTSGLAVASGAIFNYQPTTVGSALTMGAGSTLNLAGGGILGLNWDATTASKIVAGGAATVGGNVKVSMTGAYNSGTAYTILQAASGLNTGSYTAINNTDYTAVFTQSATSVMITPTTATPLAAAYWKGGTSGYASVLSVASNWTTDGAGTVSGLTPGAAANVYFSDVLAGGVNQADITMGANMALNSSTVNGTTGTPVNINPTGLSATGGYTLTLGSTTGAGITMNPGSGAMTLNPAIALGTAQAWTNNSGSALTVNGAVSNGANTLTVAGTGNTTINGVLGNGAGGITK
ncbi:MAG: autotransporter-associated beta strand repeat-containing protein, partial [Kiritimatiellia bacterium]